MTTENFMTHDFVRSSLNLILSYRDNNYDNWTNDDSILLEKLVRYRLGILEAKEVVLFNIQRKKIITKIFNSKKPSDAKLILLYDGYLRNSETYTKSVLYANS